MAASFKVKKAQVVKMFEELNFKTASKWKDPQLSDKLNKLNDMVDAKALKGMEDKELRNLAKAILGALEDGKTIVLDVKGAAAAKPAKKAAAKKPAKKGKASADDDDDEEEEDEDEDEDEEEEEDADDEDGEDDDEDEEDSDDEESDDEEEEEEDDEDEEESDDEDDDEEEEDDEDEDEDDEEEAPKKKGKASAAKKPAKKAAAKKPAKKPAKKAAAKEKGPGVIETIITFLKEATKDAPLSKKALFRKLVKKFPDREASLMGTINTNVPSKLKSDKGIVVKKNDDGYWIPKGAAGRVKEDE